MEMFFVVGAKVYSIQFEGYKSFPSGIENEVEISPYLSNKPDFLMILWLAALSR